ncbi:MAG: dihydrolipoamide acetyltransferase family protein [Anaerovoracaceae bacterium]|jgi:pyruvate dehydrogenase E2 component (dihydrolipoamide acetyltransferase)
MAEQIIPATRIRKIIARRLQDSWNTSPSFMTCMEVDTTNLKEFRRKLEEQHGRKISINVILMKAIAKALLEYPYVNGSYQDDNLILHDDVNIGFAVSLEEGLIVPNVKNCDKKTFMEVAEEVDQLIEAARSGKLKLDDMTGGTFTLSSMAAVEDVLLTVPIINQPEVGILGVYMPKDTPVVIDGSIVVRPMMNLSLVTDHRMVDGVMAGRFLKRIKQFITDPSEI